MLGNIADMEAVIGLATSVGRFGLDDLLSVHRRLMEQSPVPELGGVVRTEQNWIGGSSYNPCSAAFVPPPPDRVEPPGHGATSPAQMTPTSVRSRQPGALSSGG